MSSFLTREQVLQSRLRYEDVEVPAWGGTIRVVALSGMRRLEYLKAQFGDDGNLRNAGLQEAVLVAFTACNEQEELLFTLDDAVTLIGKDAAALTAVSQVAGRLCGFTKEAVEAAQKN